MARLIGATADPAVCAWVAAMDALPEPPRLSKFPRTSVVRTYRNYKLCGYEVWRHLETKGADPTRKKARLWFGNTRHGGDLRARRLAYKAAAVMSRMTQRELREWWSEYQAARLRGRAVTNLWRDEPVVLLPVFSELHMSYAC
jgi:hypothetical protein